MNGVRMTNLHEIFHRISRATITIEAPTHVQNVSVFSKRHRVSQQQRGNNWSGKGAFWRNSQIYPLHVTGSLLWRARDYHMFRNHLTG
jgi:hypothetical protein